jgi:hypothetical protein
VPQAAAMLETFPATMNVDRGLLAAAIEACLDCSQVCTACADACLSEDDPASMVKCVRDDLDCADICTTTMRVLSRHTGYDADPAGRHVRPRLTRAQLTACIAACTACADSCAEHADHHEHCRICAETCRRCVNACQELLDSIS